MRLAALLAVAAGLATFAVCGEAVARANRQARAQTELGTARQVTAQFETGHDPQDAVRRASTRAALGHGDGDVVTGRRPRRTARRSSGT